MLWRQVTSSYVGDGSSHWQTRTTALVALMIGCQMFRSTTLVQSSQVEQSLYGRLVNGPRSNNRQLRPVKNHATPVRVGLRVSMVDVIGLDENQGHVTVKLWISLRWKDEYLSWNPAQYDGIRRMNLATGPDSRIWTPDVMMFNAMNDDSLSTDVHTDAVVTSDGTVTWVRPVIYTVAAQHEFRTNSWSSSFRFGSWSYDASRLDLHPDTAATFVDNNNVVPGSTSPDAAAPPTIRMDTGNFVQTDHWAILDSRGRLEATIYPCCPDEPYSSITYLLKLRKKAGPSLLGRRGI